MTTTERRRIDRAIDRIVEPYVRSAPAVVARTGEDRIDRAVERTLTSSLWPDPPVVGCSDAEIAELERATGVALPATYERFLRRVGRRAGHFRRGHHLYYPAVLDLTDRLRDWLDRSALDRELRATEVAFFEDQQVPVFLFFDAADGEDPPVYRTELDPGVTRHADSVSEWAVRAAERHRDTPAARRGLERRGDRSGARRGD